MSGYWLFSDRGRVFPYGDARSFGGLGALRLNGGIVASAATPTGLGYYMVGADGGVFAFGDAQFRGSMGGQHLNQPVVGIAPTPDNAGYWLVAADGGVFAFSAPFRGSMGNVVLNQPVKGLVAYGNGYLMVAADGGVFDFSNRAFLGSLGGRHVVGADRRDRRVHDLSPSGSRGEVADRSDVAERDLDDARLHRVAHAGHRSAGAGSRPGCASRSMPRPMPMSHARRSVIARSASSSGSISSAQRMNPPFQGATSNGACGSTMPSHGDVPRERGARRRPRAGSATRRCRDRGAGSRRRRRVRRVPTAACVIAWQAASNWCVQFCFGSVHCPAAVNRRDSGMPASSRSGTAASGHVDHGQRSERLARLDPLAVVAQGDHEVVEVVLEVGHHDSGLERDDADPPAVRVGVEVEVGRAEMTSASG